MKSRTIMLMCGLLLVLGGLGAMVAPEAGAWSSSWVLDIKFYDPQRITLTLPGDTRETTFWYMLFEVTNDTGEDVEFYPSFRLVTNTLKVVEGGAEVSPSVYDAIMARHKKEHPFITTPAKITGPLLQGEDNARTSVAVFRTFDRNASGFTIYASGLSGDIVRVHNPGFDDSKEESSTNPRFFILRRTLAITYDLPGDPETRAMAKPVRRSREWVMR
jgi:hypothetical protein